MEGEDVSRESACGISEVLRSDLAGFSCRCKVKWQDFHVHEVDANGLELHLEELITPGAVSAELKAATVSRRELRASFTADFQPQDDILSSLTAALGETVTCKLIAFLRLQRAPRAAAAAAHSDSSTTAPPEGRQGQDGAAEAARAEASDSADPPGYLDVDASTIADGSKDARKGAHRAILDAFGTVLNTETLESKDDSKTIRIWMREAELRVKGPPGSGSLAAGTDNVEAGKDGKGGKGKGKKGKKGKGKGKKGKSKGKAPDDEAQAGDADGGGFGTVRREGWPRDRPQYLYFRLYKENCDTGEAVASMAKCVGRSAKSFTFAGTKDRRAMTVQLVCAHKLPADQLRRTLTHRNWDRRLRICSLEYRPERLRLGQLSGNQFGVVLREVPADLELSVLQNAFEAVKQNGFLNYFGLQRFGTRFIGTHHIGAMMLARRWEAAVRLLLGDESALPADIVTRKRGSSTVLSEPVAKKARTEGVDEMDTGSQDANSVPGVHAPNSDEVKTVSKGGGKGKNSFDEARRIFAESGDAQKALDVTPKFMHIERCILGALARGLPYAEALKQLPHQQLSLYVHAAQSYVWNSVVSRRVKELGTKPVKGDLVFSDSKSASASVEELLTADSAFEEDDDDDDIDEAEAAVLLPSVRSVDTDEAAGSTNLTDVVMPLPGSEVDYPESMRAAYVEVASELGLKLDDFHTSALVPLRGAYRPVAVLPRNVEWRFVPSADVAAAPFGVLQRSDVGKLLDERPDWKDPTTEAKEEAKEEADSSNAALSSTSSGAAVVFSVQLPPSAYLTMFLREVSKRPVATLEAR